MKKESISRSRNLPYIKGTDYCKKYNKIVYNKKERASLKMGLSPFYYKELVWCDE